MTYRWTVFALVLTTMLSVSAAPAAAQDQKTQETWVDDGTPHSTIRGRVQSVQEDRIVLRSDEGREVTVNAKDISATARGLVQTGERIIVTGPLKGAEMHARSLTVAASTAGARALAGQAPFVPDAAGAASPTQRDQQRR